MDDNGNVESVDDNNQLSHSIALYRQLHNEKRQSRALAMSSSCSYSTKCIGQDGGAIGISGDLGCVNDELLSNECSQLSTISDIDATQSCNSSDVLSIGTKLSTTDIDRQIKVCCI